MPAARSTEMLAGAVEGFLTAFYRASLATPAADPGEGSVGAVPPLQSPRTLLIRLITARVLQDDPQTGVALTPSGRRVSLAVLRRHPLLAAYLVSLSSAEGRAPEPTQPRLDFPELTHVLRWLVDAIEQHEAVPGAALDWVVPGAEVLPYVALTDLPLGAIARLRRIDTDERHTLRRLESGALRPGTRLTVVARDPNGGPITVRVRGRCVVLEHDVGARVLCE